MCKFNFETGARIHYLNGHSMGLQPKLTEVKVMEVLNQWEKERDVMNLFRHHWIPLQDKLY